MLWLATALEIAEDDGYLRREEEAWVTTHFADGALIDSEHIVYIEKCIIDFLEEVGLAGRDVLAEAVGAPAFDSGEFKEAL
jgi:hypothetical protein